MLTRQLIRQQTSGSTCAGHDRARRDVKIFHRHSKFSLSAPGKARRLLRGWLSITVCLTTLVAFHPSAAEETKGPAPGVGNQFDIPAQPLAKALFAYSSLTGIEVLLPGEILADRRSTAVRGLYPPTDALRILLGGTGLTLQFTGEAHFTLVKVAPPRFPDGRFPEHPVYSAALQRAVIQALCRFGATQPGGYRLAARLWIGPKGEATRVELLGTTGITARDDVLAGVLRRVSVGIAPPLEIAQPTTIVLLPRQATDCAVMAEHRP
ncbi:STN domain-containing protein [Microbacteriaceae bacterium K1510]|nr:STN domain-containing protein [Microbacteriaceae bacterium K1510]